MYFFWMCEFIPYPKRKTDDLTYPNTMKWGHWSISELTISLTFSYFILSFFFSDFFENTEGLSLDNKLI